MTKSDLSGKIIWYSASVIFVIAVCLCVQANARLFLLPYAKITGFIWNIPFTYNTNIGYVSADGALAITPDCSGAKMFSALFLISAIGFPPKDFKFKSAFLFFISSAVKLAAVTFVLTFIRISLSLKLNYTPNPNLAHNILSLAIFFGAACLTYLYLSKKRSMIYEE